MSAIVFRQRGGVRFGVAERFGAALSEEGCVGLMNALLQPVPAGRDALSGRRQVVPAECPGIGGVVVKHYARGGATAKLVKNRYFRWGTTRGQHEFEMLEAVRRCGVRAPEPIAFVTQGIVWYRAWLVMRRIDNTISLAELAAADEERTRKVMDEVTRQISLLVRERLYHVDLHPGNVLVDEHDHVYLVDFDKARRYTRALNELRDHYLCRWRRAVIKHELPEALSELMGAGLRRNFD
jgi:3-deoxy-D-manno-octulosonic acid kinase